MKLTDYRPKSQLVTKTSTVQRPRFSVIDAHNHLGPEFGGGWSEREVSNLVEVMDMAGIERLVDLDGGWGEAILQQRLDKFKAIIPERYLVFGGVDWDAWPEHGDHFGDWAAERLRRQVAWGAQGLKIWKNLGLHVRDQKNELVTIDDPRLDPIWAVVGELGVPVMIHVGDPAAFFDPLNKTNERWEELHAYPDWHFPSPPFPPLPTILDQLASVIRRHPTTTFIGAHVGCYAENLAWVGALLDRCPNFYIDISARLAELGRQPYTARRFFIDYADRILFGTDHPAMVPAYQLYYRFLETDDEYFNYSLMDPPEAGRWRIYGLSLPDEVLAKVYRENATRLLPEG